MHRSASAPAFYSRIAGACLLLLGALAMPASGQIPMGMPQQDTLFSGAKILTMDGEPIIGGHLLISGKRIRFVGPVAPPSAEGTEAEKGRPPQKPRVVEAAGKVIMPIMIDGASVIGLDPASGRTLPYGDITDRIDLFERDVMGDAVAEGVGFAFVGGAAPAGGIGSKGAVISLANTPRDEPKDVVQSGTAALFIAVGVQVGSLSRVAEVARLANELRAAKKYEEEWDAYKEALKKYEAAIAEKAKKNPSGAASQPTAEAPKPAAEPTPAPGPRTGRGPGPRPFPRPPRAWENTPWAMRIIESISIPQAIFVVPHSCPICGGVGHDDDHHNKSTFDFFEFAPRGDGFEGEDFFFEDPPKPAGQGPDGAPASKPDDQKPAEPQFDPAREELVKALNGKLRVRIDVDRAEDILNVLALLKEFPLDVTLVGVAEGRYVAREIADAGYSVIVAPRPVLPIQEVGRAAETANPFPFPFDMGDDFIPMPQRGGADAGPSVDQSASTAAILAHYGIKTAIGSVGSPDSSTASLLLAAAYAAGKGMPVHDALAAVTRNAAEILGLDDMGKIATGKLANFIVFSGEPFAPGTVVESVYIEGRRVYARK